jgi:hypothetical protein
MMAAVTSMPMKEMEKRTSQQQQVGQQSHGVSPMFAQHVEAADEQDRQAKQ